MILVMFSNIVLCFIAGESDGFVDASRAIRFLRSKAVGEVGPGELL